MLRLNHHYNLSLAKYSTVVLIEPQMPVLMCIVVGFGRDREPPFSVNIRDCHPNADSYRYLTQNRYTTFTEKEKKRKYGPRTTEVEQGTFTPLILTTTGGMAEECQLFHTILAELLSTKKKENYATTISWIRAKVSFAILRSAQLCLRSRFTIS